MGTDKKEELLIKTMKNNMEDYLVEMVDIVSNIEKAETGINYKTRNKVYKLGLINYDFYSDIIYVDIEREKMKILRGLYDDFYFNNQELKERNYSREIEALKELIKVLNLTNANLNSNLYTGSEDNYYKTITVFSSSIEKLENLLNILEIISENTEKEYVYEIYTTPSAGVYFGCNLKELINEVEQDMKNNNQRSYIIYKVLANEEYKRNIVINNSEDRKREIELSKDNPSNPIYLALEYNHDIKGVYTDLNKAVSHIINNPDFTLKTEKDYRQRFN